MKKGQCKLKIYTHNFYEDGTEGEEERFISYYKIKLINQKEQNLFKGKHKKNKSLNIQNKDLNIKEIIQDNNKLNQTPLKKIIQIQNIRILMILIIIKTQILNQLLVVQ